MAYNRKIECTIGQNNGLNLLLSDLNMTFDIKRSYNIESNTARFVIYNAKEETRNKILTKNNNITLSAGYEDEGTGLIFSGFISDVSSTYTGLDWETEITGSDYGSNSTNIFNKFATYGYKEGMPISMVISDIASALGVVISGIENVSGIIMNNAKQFNGLIKDIVKMIDNILKVNDVGLYFDSNSMVLYKLKQKDSKFGIVNISSSSGLINSVEEITDNSNTDQKKRYAFNSLMNAKIKPNALINIQSAIVNGLLIVENVNYKGDNFGGTDFGCRIEAVE